MSVYEAEKALDEKINLLNKDEKTNKIKNDPEVPFFKREIQNGIYEITEQYKPEKEKINKKINKKKNVECFSLNDFLSKKAENQNPKNEKLINKEIKNESLKKIENKKNENKTIEKSPEIKKESLFKQRMRLKKQQNK